ncbi:dienelactone hydrolase family protein [Streptomyces sp. NBC_01089]|uniref:alpha/beta hydrolase family protein n=1 Tax=Streptomyces sp. NBC_01089 TaxID=2903747 RepID=UPI0038672506|nr:dienelactone hydrolase family protein [Streptomyces sp. NBC_01089]WSU46275.1 dienelactone hydrolase family protein [Streptomyces sp. NBC_01089]
MTVFILVPGTYTGGWIWEELACLLRESGAQAHPVTLTGLGDRRHLAGPGTDLETHIQDLVTLIDQVNAQDQVDTQELVLVGHGYGIHPVLGAAGRRPERIGRIVHLDTGIPQDGEPALSLVPDQKIRELLLDAADTAEATATAGAGAGAASGAGAGAGAGRVVPVPACEEWQRWGSTAGLSEQALARLTRLAAPHPAGTLTQPLRLTGAAAALPATGILCTRNGSSIATVEAFVGLGDPRVQELVERRVTFFELHTGHWPMLSAPAELCTVLLEAAAGGGHLLDPAAGERPAHLRPFLLDVPEQPRERAQNIDLHLPRAQGPRPAVVFVHGGPVPAGVLPTPRDWPAFTGYGQYVAGLGAVGVTVDHRLHDITGYEQAAGDIAAAVERVRADPRVDEDRIALWFFSAGALIAADWIAAPPPWLRCVAATYPVLAPPASWGLSDTRFRPAAALRTGGALPIVLTRVEHERVEIAATVEEFLTAAAACRRDIEVIDVPDGVHGFETAGPTEESRQAVHDAVRSVLTHLGN